MGKRYYCEFCDKSFADNATNKRNHLKGLFHHRMKKLHYDAFREPEVILEEESAKMPCHRFETTGECNFGDNCRYSHLTAERRQQLERQIQAKREAAAKTRQEDDEEIRLEDWLLKRQKTGEAGDIKTEAVSTSSAKIEESTPVYSLPPALMMIPNIPPSLLPPPPGVSQNNAEWG